MNPEQLLMDPPPHHPAPPRDARLAAQRIFAEALQHHQAGRLNEAERRYREVLTVYARHADSLHLMGMVAHQRGRHEQAVELIGQAIAINPRAALFHANLGNALVELQRMDDAVASFRAALRLQPNCLEAHVNLGNTLLALGKAAEAVTAYGRALTLKPDLPEAHNNMGSAQNALGRLEEAAVCYRQALALRPNYAEAQRNLGSVLIALGRTEDAVAACERAVALQPDAAEAHIVLGNALRERDQLDAAVLCFGKALSLRPDSVEACNNLGNVLREQGRWDEAAAYCRRALDLAPGFVEAHVTLGNTLREQGRLEDAASCFQTALALRPDDPAAHNNLGITLKQQGNLEEAAACYRRALALRPDYPDAHNNLGVMLNQQGLLDEAAPCFRQALAHQPDDANAHFNLAVVLLARGDMSAGWPEFEWRWQTVQLRKARRRFTQPQWHGEPANGRTLLIHAEQGFGDTLQFCRYAPLAAARGWRVVMEVQKPLVRLMGSLGGVAQVVAAGASLPGFDVHCPMMSLPLAFGTTLESIPAADAYLHADPAQSSAWQDRLAPGPLRVGLVWAGNPRLHSPAMAQMDRRRSIPADRLAPLFDIACVEFFSLQKDGPQAPDGFPLTNLMDEMGDFADTAALISALDLVIAVDTAVAHLAAALGKPVWLLDRFDPCWRWLTGRRDSPWYPSLRLYRQTRPGDWDAVVDEVARDLRALVQTREG